MSGDMKPKLSTTALGQVLAMLKVNSVPSEGMRVALCAEASKELDELLRLAHLGLSAQAAFQQTPAVTIHNHPQLPVREVAAVERDLLWALEMAKRGLSVDRVRLTLLLASYPEALVDEWLGVHQLVKRSSPGVTLSPAIATGASGQDVAEATLELALPGQGVS